MWTQPQNFSTWLIWLAQAAEPGYRLADLLAAVVEQGARFPVAAGT